MANSDLYGVVTAPISVAAATTAYWTPERMRNAKPMPIPRVSLTMLRRLVQAQRGPGGVAAALGPDFSSPVRVAPVPPDAAPVAAVSAATTKRVENRSVYPYAVVGKIFMSFPGGDFQGSAWVIGERAVFSAGHCMYDHNAGGWASNVMFHAQYHQGTDVGKWALTQRAALKEWVNSRDFPFDMSVGIADTPIRPTTGKAGYIANQPPDQAPFLSIGYPANPTPKFPFDGQEMWESTGGYIPFTPEPIPPGDGEITMDNDMTQGCSGGPWFTSKGGGQPVACGLNSFITDFPPDQMNSPYFGTAFLRIVQWMKDNGGDA